jgi:hypothetical protein
MKTNTEKWVVMLQVQKLAEGFVLRDIAVSVNADNAEEAMQLAEKKCKYITIFGMRASELSFTPVSANYRHCMV